MWTIKGMCLAHDPLLAMHALGEQGSQFHVLKESEMSIPSTSALQHSIMRLIGSISDFTVTTREATRRLEPMFPQLTWQEANAPYPANGTRFGNAAQVAVNDLRADGWLESSKVSGKGVWRFSQRARTSWSQVFLDGNELLAEMMTS